jgi:hypothetical protein
MQRIYSVTLVCLAFSQALLGQSTDDAAATAKAAEPASPTLAAHYGKLPLSFEANLGQTDSQVRFLSRGNGYSLFLTDRAAVLALTKTEANGKLDQSRLGRVTGGEGTSSRQAATTTDFVRMELTGEAKNVHVDGADQLPGVSNYFIGNDPSNWRSHVPTYGKVKYSSVYPGVDLVYYGNQRQLEYDFVVAPHADAGAIRLHFAGAAKLALNADGDLTVTAKHGEIAFHKPVVYQVKDGKREMVGGEFTLLAKDAVGFKLGGYDPSRELVVDPALVYSTYLGGSGGCCADDSANGIAVDSQGNAYVTGAAVSTDFPVSANAFQKINESNSASSTSAFVTKFNPQGSALIYSTYLGGSSSNSSGEYGAGIAVDRLGNAYITGPTGSKDFPVTSEAFQKTKKSKSGSVGFVAKLNPSGTALLYSTYLGGSVFEGGGGLLGDASYVIAIDSFGDAYIAGSTSSSDFPITSDALQTTYGNAFLTKLNAGGSGLIYSTYFGGTPNTLLNTFIEGIALNSMGEVYVTGSTSSHHFPVTKNAFQPVNKSPYRIGFVSKLNTTGSALTYSTYLGGTGGDGGAGIVADNSGNAYVVGSTSSYDFPVTSNAYQRSNNGGGFGENAFVTKLNPAGTTLLYSTLLGGGNFINPDNPYDIGTDIAIDKSGDAYITGTAASTDFPTTADAFQ